jgi:hypothetical protein
LHSIRYGLRDPARCWNLGREIIVVLRVHVDTIDVVKVKWWGRRVLRVTCIQSLTARHFVAKGIGRCDGILLFSNIVNGTTRYVVRRELRDLVRPPVSNDLLIKGSNCSWNLASNSITHALHGL